MTHPRNVLARAAAPGAGDARGSARPSPAEPTGRVRLLGSARSPAGATAKCNDSAEPQRDWGIAPMHEAA